MSVEDINKEKLANIRRKLDSTPDFQFSKALQSTFSLNGAVPTVEAIWLNDTQNAPDRLEPIIIESTSIRPIMSTHIESRESQQEDALHDRSPMEEDLPDMAHIIESIESLAISSSQLQTQQNRNKVLCELIDLPQAQLKAVLSSTDIASWTDDITADLLVEMEKSSTVSIASATLLVYRAVYPKISKSTTNIQRLLMNNIILLARKESRCIVDGLLLPLMFLSDLGKSQCEVVTKVAGEMSNSMRMSVLQAILCDGEVYFADNQYPKPNESRRYLRPWNENVFLVIGTILSTQPLLEFTKASLFDLVKVLQSLVQSNPKDKGSMQTLLLLTSKYSQAIVDFEAIALVENICQSSTMFLKRAVLGQITNIKKKSQMIAK